MYQLASEELIDDESDGGGVSLPPADAREQSVGDFMDEMKRDDEELPPPATETLLQNAEVEEALDDIFQMAGDSEQSASTRDSAPESASGEAAEASTDDQASESDATEETEPKKKKGFFKKLFG